MQKLLISFSGGRTSAFMTWWLLRHMQGKYEMIVVFANTGKEKEETLKFVHDCDVNFGFNTVWIEAVENPLNGFGVTAKIVDYFSANRNGQVFEDVIAKHGLPNQETPLCSRQMKEEAIRAYARSIGWIGKKYKTAIGIRADEPRRLNWVKAKKKHLIYPLATMRRTIKADVAIFWKNQSFTLNLKSYEGNCDWCWKKAFRKLKTIAVDNPDVTAWWKEMEQKYENFIPESRKKEDSKIKLPLRMYRGNMTVDEIIEDSKFPFVPARDESNDTFKQLELFDVYEDEEGECVESCEAF